MLGIWIGLIIMFLGACILDATMQMPAAFLIGGLIVFTISLLRYRRMQRG